MNHKNCDEKEKNFLSSKGNQGDHKKKRLTGLILLMAGGGEPEKH